MRASILTLTTSLLALNLLIGCGDPIESALPPDNISAENTLPQSVTPPTVQVPAIKTSSELKLLAEAPLQAAPATNTPAKPMNPTPAKITLTGEQPFFPVKKCMNVANALEAPNEGEWGYTIRMSELSVIARSGFDTIRLPVRWDSHMLSSPPYSISSLHMERVKTVVYQAQREGLGVILDVHHYEDLIENPRSQEARFLALWEQIATTFQNAPPTVYFEILNEPTNAMSMRQLNQLYRKVIPLIRKTNPTRTLIIGGNSWNSVDTMDAIAWPLDKNLVATFHDYGPHEFTHQGAPWTSDQWPTGRKWGSKADMAELQDTYDIAARFQTKRNVPILVGEFGVIDTVPQAERNEWVKYRRKFMESAGYSWCAWDLTGAFTMYDLNKRQWRSGALEALFSD